MYIHNIFGITIFIVHGAEITTSFTNNDNLESFVINDKKKLQGTRIIVGSKYVSSYSGNHG